MTWNEYCRKTSTSSTLTQWTLILLRLTSHLARQTKCSSWQFSALSVFSICEKRTSSLQDIQSIVLFCSFARHAVQDVSSIENNKQYNCPRNMTTYSANRVPTYILYTYYRDHPSDDRCSPDCEYQRKANLRYALWQFFGSKMTANFISIHSGVGVRQAMRELISQSAENDNISRIYVIDEDEAFVGAIDLKDLIIARAETALDSITTTSYPYVYLVVLKVNQ